ncbi:MAG TPA: aminopeptidase [Steroidobacteraceae bacterium]|jgi:predicted aminopeptidase|nr:aminopeptidase [Steroidobacteraceae bacterium]
MVTVHGLARLALIVLATTMLPACGTMYLAQAARGQWQVSHAREPIEAVIADPHTSDDLRARLTEVRTARQFASRELGLPDNSSYRTYADVKRRYVVWNVVAAPEFSVKPKRWCFPIAGCVAYRGYFSERGARKFAAALRKKGFDVVVGGVPAYSTLGKLSDPVLNTMLSYGDDELAAIIFHELSHQVVYVAGDSEFNEAFAVTVEETGLERWLKAQGHERDLARYKTRRRHQQQYLALFTRTRAQLADLYAQDIPREEMRARKADIFRKLADEIRALDKKLGGRSGYDDWIEEGLNNAHLASVATYYDCVPGFTRLLALHNGNLPEFYDAVRELAKKPRAERHALLCTTPETEDSAPGPSEPPPAPSSSAAAN